jgi:hypothetical protein
MVLSHTEMDSQQKPSQLMAADLVLLELLAAGWPRQGQGVISMAKLLAAVNAGDEGGDHRFASVNEKGLPMSRVDHHPLKCDGFRSTRALRQPGR